MFANSHNKVLCSEVLVPGWVEETVSSSQDPAITDEAGPTQQVLRAFPEQHHLPRVKSRKTPKASGLSDVLKKEGLQADLCLSWQTTVQRKHILQKLLPGAAMAAIP